MRFRFSKPSIEKGTREFSIDIFDDPTYALIDTEAFGNTYFKTYNEMDEVSVTDGLSQLNVDDEPALSFTYSHDGNEVMTTVMIHDNKAYAFKYSTMKENFEEDYDTMTRFLSSVRFLD